jgi:hypothetical protein
MAIARAILGGARSGRQTVPGHHRGYRRRRRRYGPAADRSGSGRRWPPRQLTAQAQCRRPRAAAILTPVLGRLGDMFGKRLILLVSLLLSARAARVAAVAPDIWIVVAARAVQGRRRRHLPALLRHHQRRLPGRTQAGGTGPDLGHRRRRRRAASGRPADRPRLVPLDLLVRDHHGRVGDHRSPYPARLRPAHSGAACSSRPPIARCSRR